MTHRKQINEILTWLKAIEPEFCEHPEAQAAISHWIYNPDVQPPILPETLFKLRQGYQVLSGGEDWAGFEIERADLRYVPREDPDFTFIDLFAGIGGFRISMQKNGGRCVFTSEWDKHAKVTYECNFGEIPYGDIRVINEMSVPDHDILCAGFPCQPFSLAGVSKKNSLGRKHGFEDETQGTLFFDIKRILAVKRPKAFFLENVKNLRSHDSGKTFEVIRHTLEDELKYEVNWAVVDGANWVPQHRERLFIVGFDPKQVDIKKDEIEIPSTPSNGYVTPNLKSIIKDDVSDDRYTLGPGTWATLKRHKAHHKKAGNGFGYGLHKLPIADTTVTRTMSARYHKDGAEILIEQKGNERPRKLTIEEALKIQGFDPDKFDMSEVSLTQAYRQIGNSVVVPAITEVSKYIVGILRQNEGV